MTSDILTSIVETLDVLEVFDRSTGKTTCMLLDGHGSRLGPSFLNYINNPLHPWAACIGVSYGTIIETQEIMILVKYALDQSFANVNGNRDSIAERVWFPLNCDILLDKQLCSTMTDEERYEEDGGGIVYHLPYLKIML